MTDHARRALLASGDLLSIAQAAKRSPYSAEYLSYLARKGKLPAIKLARNWVTTGNAIAHYIEEQKHRHRAIITRLALSGKEQR
jgi:recombinational DNA repair protein RecR